MPADLAEMTLGLRNFSYALAQFMTDPESLDRHDMTAMMFTLKSRADTLADDLDQVALRCGGDASCREPALALPQARGA
ncbi:hypothetical protein [Mangrovicoccus ximenensis]|uniref:hypothetical protein n=1 Tax=Mangrovicoccus ximenensis TaxID=1911570 RepID=UPI000D370430|nr:hypothetical protein [Mangrovicoccus ximenensis]